MLFEYLTIYFTYNSVNTPIKD